jgi:hypothetical protein
MRWDAIVRFQPQITEQGIVRSALLVRAATTRKCLRGSSLLFGICRQWAAPCAAHSPSRISVRVAAGRERPPLTSFTRVLTPVGRVAHAPIAGPDAGHGLVVDPRPGLSVDTGLRVGLRVIQLVVITWSLPVVS